jgi:hypothetical protein
MIVATPQVGATTDSGAETTAPVNHTQARTDNMNEQVAPMRYEKSSKSGVGKKVTIVFISLLLLVILLSSLLYMIFSAMSN